MVQLDETDRKLLDILQEDDRIALADMSKKVGLAPSTINQRIKRLVADGVISGFHARLDPEKVNLDLLAFMMVGWSDPSVEVEFLERIRESPSVLECHHVTGVWNYLLKVRVRNTRELEQLLSGTIKAVPGVERTETIITLSTAKEQWTLSASA